MIVTSCFVPDVGVIECSGSFRLPAETGFNLFVTEQMTSEKLQGDRTFEVGVLRLVQTPIPPSPSFSVMR